ncbi:MAG TPA: hypothetical protein VK914_01505 [bacterium]|nr:hypothetical protein [bacterium]
MALRTQGKAGFARYRPGLGHGALGIRVGIVVILDFFKAHMADGTKARMVLDDLRMHGALVHNAMVALRDRRNAQLTEVSGENYAKNKRDQRPKKRFEQIFIGFHGSSPYLGKRKHPSARAAGRT